MVSAQQTDSQSAWLMARATFMFKRTVMRERRKKVAF